MIHHPTTSQVHNLLPVKQSDADSLAQNVAQGLSQSPKALSSRFFYDAKGSQLFQQIMALPEYYLTQLEYQIFQQQRKEILYAFGTQTPFQLIDLGAGDAYKTKLLLQELVEQEARFTFIPLDISQEPLHQLVDELGQLYPHLPVTGLAAEYFQGLHWLNEHGKDRKLVLFLGSNIGNFSPVDAENFLLKLRSSLGPQDRLLLGLDLRKDPRKIRQAYDDASGVTAAFNLNLLTRINHELQANFDVDQFEHFAEYNPITGTMRSYLVSRQNQEVHLKALNKTFYFEAWEAIHTENSQKYSLREIQEMARHCHLAVEDVFTDASHGFADVLLRPIG
ncbi:L-histidine N(alpha)-methyltransferase [Rufibacter soli]